MITIFRVVIKDDVIDVSRAPSIFNGLTFLRTEGEKERRGIVCTEKSTLKVTVSRDYKRGWKTKVIVVHDLHSQRVESFGLRVVRDKFFFRSLTLIKYFYLVICMYQNITSLVSFIEILILHDPFKDKLTVYNWAANAAISPVLI